jgi:hypothetical protein
MMKTIFIIGVDHSGTTILYKMLAQHPALCWFSQFSMRGGEIPGRRRLPGNVLANRVGRKLFHPVWQKQATIPARYIPTPNEAPKIWDYLVPDTKHFWYEDDCTEEMKRRLQYICEQECKQWKKTFLLIKRPRLTRSVRLLATCLPDSSFIHIIRDGKAVSLSNMQKLSRKIPDRREALKLSAMYWKDVVTYVDDAREVLDKRLKSIRYEDFCKDVHQHIAKILENVGLSADGLYNRLPKTIAVTNNKHFDECPPIYKEDINTLLGTALPRYGYEPFTL